MKIVGYFIFALLSSGEPFMVGWMSQTMTEEVYYSLKTHCVCNFSILAIEAVRFSL